MEKKSSAEKLIFLCKCCKCTYCSRVMLCEEKQRSSLFWWWLSTVERTGASRNITSVHFIFH